MEQRTTQVPRRSRGSGRNIPASFRSVGSAFLCAFLAVFPLCLSAQQVASATLSEAPQPQHAVGPGVISGVVVDPTGAAIAGARVILTAGSPPRSEETQTEANGGFVFQPEPAGPFQLTITAPSFAARTVAGALEPGQIYNLPQIALAVGQNNVDVEVGLTREEIAQVQLDVEEKQRLFGVVPNYYVSYLPHAVPLSPKQKFTLAGKLVLDPVSFAITGAVAGIQQANNDYSGFGNGAAGYGKRYAASTGTFLTGVVIGNAILPSILKQDPRYFYKGTGTVKSRVLYAMAMAVMCKGDNGNWQVNYSGILGGLAAGGLANLYYPAKDRDGLELTFANAAIGTAESAAGNVVQEFLFRRLTSHSAKEKATP
jgi:hypothetical protein